MDAVDASLYQYYESQCLFDLQKKSRRQILWYVQVLLQRIIQLVVL